ncbi:MAG: hypothetical protein KJZ69_03720 [Phycisphaerales bacterium]|nr:hypothetical protein [Phycisphaerales bacterium]
MRSTIKWGGTVLTVLLLLAWVGSRWRKFGGYMLPTAAATVDGGQLCIGWLEPWSPIPDSDGCIWVWSHSYQEFAWWFDFDGGPIQTGHTALYVYVPVWTLVLLAGLPTASVWYRDRRRAPGLCIKCGYDLRGNTSGVCPECGGEAPRAVS